MMAKMREALHALVRKNLQKIHVFLDTLLPLPCYLNLLHFICSVHKCKHQNIIMLILVKNGNVIDDHTQHKINR